MKTFKLIMALVMVGMLWLPAQALAKGAQGVQWTVHNLSSSSPYMYASDNEDEICIFCHTPHGGNLAGPLWNKDLPAANSFTLYTSSTLETAAADTTRPVQNESLLCLSCHDGSIGVNRILNPSNTNGVPTIVGNPDQNMVNFAASGPGPIIGASATLPFGPGDLSDDHPISFSYQSAYNDETAKGLDGLRSPADAIARGVRFFGSTYRLECSSCHDPHVDYDTSFGGGAAGSAYDPFLITPNTGSALCLACHVK